jgi:hypothetical protein
MQRTVVYTSCVKVGFFRVLDMVYFLVYMSVISLRYFGFIYIWGLLSVTLFPVLPTDLVSDVVTNSVVSETIRRVVASEREVVAPQSHEMKHTLLFVALVVVAVGAYLVLDAHNALDAAFTWDIPRILDFKGLPEISVNWGAVDQVNAFSAVLASATELVEDPVIQEVVQLAVHQPVAPVIGAVAAGVAVGAVLEGVGAVEELVAPANDLDAMLAMVQAVTFGVVQLNAGVDVGAIVGFDQVLAFQAWILEHGHTPEECLPRELLARLVVQDAEAILGLTSEVLGADSPLYRYLYNFFVLGV